MKKWIALIMILSMTLLTACSGVPVIRPEGPHQPAATQQPETAVPTESAYPNGAPSSQIKTGLAVIPTVASSSGAGEKNGVAQSDITLVAVLIDDNGVICSCDIDSIQAKTEFDAHGAVVSDLSVPVLTKNELGSDYGMGKFSGIGSEWSEQASYLAGYAVGKTVDELRGISLNERGAASADTDLSSSVTISIAGYLDAIELAVANAQDLGARAGDRVKVTAVTTRSGNDAGLESGQIQAYATVAALSFSDSDVITSCVIDAVQCNVGFDTSGLITTDLSSPILTKNQLGDDYGMKKASSIGREWYEQAAGFAAYITGKTPAEVAGTALTEKGTAADADLATSVTINLGAFLELVAKVGAV